MSSDTPPRHHHHVIVRHLLAYTPSPLSVSDVIYEQSPVESDKQILGTVLFCNRILTLTDSCDKQSCALPKRLNKSTNFQMFQL